MKQIVVLASLFALWATGCRNNREVANYRPDDTPSVWRYVTTVMQDSLYGISVEFITEREFARLSKRSYEYECVELDSTSEECKRMHAQAIRFEKSYDDEWGGLLGFRKYPQTDQYEMLFERPYGVKSLMVTGGEVVSNWLYCDLHSYSMDGIYAYVQWTDCDFACGVTFLRFNPETNGMEAVGRYTDSRFAFEEWGSDKESSIRWIAPGKLLCKGFKNPYETCWGWTPKADDVTEIESHLNQSVYLLINLKRR